MCDKVCAFNDRYDTSLNQPQPDAYATRHKNMKEMQTSRSEAAFIAISDYILENGGVVYSAGYVVTDSFHACVFSILFKKPFTVVENIDRGMFRLYNILS